MPQAFNCTHRAQSLRGNPFSSNIKRAHVSELRFAKMLNMLRIENIAETVIEIQTP